GYERTGNQRMVGCGRGAGRSSQEAGGAGAQGQGADNGRRTALAGGEGPKDRAIHGPCSQR
ncbi:MAG TPA: hypothetical protein VF888_01525, partial [Nitrospirota bacterium]